MNFNIKKIISLCLVIISIFGTVGCENTKPQNSNSSATNSVYVDPTIVGIDPLERDKNEAEMMKNVIVTNTFGGVSKWKKRTKWDSKIKRRIKSILKTKNMKLPSNKKIYYVSPNGDDLNEGTKESPWQTLDRVNNCAEPDSIVCFERGGTWRGQLVAKDGVTYTAYGKGKKPNLFASPFNGGGSENESKWKKHTDNIWVIEIGNYTLNYDVGTLVFNGGEKNAIKCIIRTEDDGKTYNNTTSEPFDEKVVNLKHDLHFYHDCNENKLYLYSKENPAKRFKSIEFNIKNHGIQVPEGTDNVTIDNLCIKYTGGHGVGAGTVKNLTVQNCEFGWIGGSIHSYNIYGRNYPTRYGNAIEIWGGCDGFKVINNYIHQVYDAGITQQYTNHDGNEYNQLNIDYSDNVIENCNYSIEYWLRAEKGEINNFKISNNYMLYAGEGFCEERPDKAEAAHIKCWATGMCSNNMTIENNLMMGTTHEVFEICPNKENADGSIVLPNIHDNTIISQKEIVVDLKNYKLWELNFDVYSKSGTLDTDAQTFTSPTHFGIISFNDWSRTPFSDYIEDSNDKINALLQGYGKASGNVFKYY